MTDRSVVLIGFMGTGKSSVGRRLALMTGWPRFDLDQMIATTLGMSITKIFARRGEEKFRDEESTALESIPTDQPAIIVTGGGIVLRQKNIRRLHKLGAVVCLTANVPTLLERLAGRSHRPLVPRENRPEILTELLRVREPLYREAADLTIDTSGLTHEEVARQIRESLALAA